MVLNGLEADHRSSTPAMQQLPWYVRVSYRLFSSFLGMILSTIAAVWDGLKAWEFLKGRPWNIDLILTEVDLPSISGYALLTLIMGHDICKSIPVIMMSSHDSFSTVYKCMMRGAADYLVKHVWRRQSSTSGKDGAHNQDGELQKNEATAKNNAESNHSSGYMACLDRDKEIIRIYLSLFSQSSCTKLDVEADIFEFEHEQDLNLKEMTMLTPESIRATRGVEVVHEKSSNSLPVDQLSHMLSCITAVRSYREAVNFIGAFDKNCWGSYGNSSSNMSIRKSLLSPELDLSLRRSGSCLTSLRTEEKHTVKQ
ncbi:hypothetical protein SAY87_030459 [Trapa incisa]|uniref:Response regulatory domain-containing protein n=1 Tax=Trapa incisa TaxID=236973 RepID=A0AAN7KVQ3_9MYRT|nr:hypothetical protein SAY87_030459 [Trapa incisa]